MKRRKLYWTITLIMVVLFNVYILFLYSLADYSPYLLLHSLRFILSIIAMAISFWNWNNPKRLYISLSVAVYTLGVFSNLFAMFVYQYDHRPFFQWNTIICTVLFSAAIFLLAQVFTTITRSSLNTAAIPKKMICSAVLIAASLLFSFPYQFRSVSESVFPTIVIVAVSTPAIILLGYMNSFLDMLEEDGIIQLIESAERGSDAKIS